MVNFETAESVYRRFFEAISPYKTIGNGFRKWVFRCPVHEDNVPSASAWLGDDGRLIIGCPVCGTRGNPTIRLQIIANLGLKVSDLMPKDQKWDSLGQLEPSNAWVYRDKEGKPLYRSCRFDLPNGRKRFTLQHWNGSCFDNGVDGVERVLYNLHEIHRADKRRIIWLVEGEKKADILGEIGMIGTCVATGSSAPWEPQFTEALRGRPVAIMPDADQASMQFAERIAGRLLFDGGFTHLALVPIEGLPAKGDVWDYIRSCRDSEMTREEIAGSINLMLAKSKFKWRKM